MVLVHFKKNQKNQFCIEVPSNTDIQTIISRLLEMLQRLSKAVDDLASYGVLRPPELQGLSYDDIAKHPEEIGKLSEDKVEYTKKPVPQQPFRYVYDKSNTRHGIVLPLEQANFLKEAARQARRAGLLHELEDKTKPSNQEQPLKTPMLSLESVAEAIDTIRGAIMVTYPGYYGLPEWEPVVLLLQNKLEPMILASQDYEYYVPDCNLWWVGKQLAKNKLLSEYTKNNQKTRIVIKLQNPGAQQPPREPPVDAETYRKMVKYYYKKTEEGKELEKQDLSNHYLTGEWANKNLKSELTIGKNISYKPF